jgi:hypothetical protein
LLYQEIKNTVQGHCERLEMHAKKMKATVDDAVEKHDNDAKRNKNLRTASWTVRTAIAC